VKNQQTTRRSPARSYRPGTWSQYNRALIQRGSITLWFPQEALQQWIASGHQLWHDPNRRRGAPRRYSDLAIATMASIQAVYRLPLRATQGLVESIMTMLGIQLPVPNYSTLARRRTKLSPKLPRLLPAQPLDLIIDATGFKIYGDGQWMHQQYKNSRHRRWRKLHIAVDAATQQILAAEVTNNDQTDGQMFEPLLEQVPEPVQAIIGDRAYDKRHCYATTLQRRARSVIPPQRNARIWKHGNCAGPRHPRDENLRMIRRRGKRAWKRRVGYGRRSLVETAFSRIKRILGEQLQTRSIAGQTAELLVRCQVLNRMALLGLPSTILSC